MTFTAQILCWVLRTKTNAKNSKSVSIHLISWALISKNFPEEKFIFPFNQTVGEKIIWSNSTEFINSIEWVIVSARPVIFFVCFYNLSHVGGRRIKRTKIPVVIPHKEELSSHGKFSQVIRTESSNLITFWLHKIPIISYNRKIIKQSTKNTFTSQNNNDNNFLQSTQLRFKCFLAQQNAVP